MKIIRDEKKHLIKIKEKHLLPFFLESGLRILKNKILRSSEREKFDDRSVRSRHFPRERILMKYFFLNYFLRFIICVSEKLTNNIDIYNSIYLIRHPVDNS